jgi:hypothetical protein
MDCESYFRSLRERETLHTVVFQQSPFLSVNAQFHLDGSIVAALDTISKFQASSNHLN